MKFLFLFLLLFGFFGEVSAQGFDPMCYFPKIGVEIDTLLRRPTEGYFFANHLIKNPNAPDSEEQIVIEGYPTNPPFMTVLSSGATLDIHKLQPRKKWNVKLTGSAVGETAIFGNFHTTKYKDAFLPANLRIYWADESGDFDSSRFTELRSSVQGNFYPETGGGFKYENMNMYVAKLTNDSLDDIVTMGYTNWKTMDEFFDSSRTYLLLFRGESLYKPNELVLSDSAFMVERVKRDSIHFDRFGNVGDYRGTGRMDWLTSDYQGNLFYFKNDAPFSMEKLVMSMRYDTLMSGWENPHLLKAGGNDYTFASSRTGLRAFPKQSWNQSVDLVARFNTDDDRNEAWFLFRGGPDFGSKRLYIDSVDFLLHKSFEFGIGYDVGFGISDCGDMTGTGNTVIATGVGAGHEGGDWLYYVLGKATDENIDIDIPVYVVDGTGGGASPVQVKADEDNLQDVAFGVTNYKGTSLDPVSSSLALLHGSKKIPVTLNPKYAVEEMKHLRQTPMYAFPNPFDERTVLTFENCSRGVMYMDVVNSLGVSVLHETIPDVDGYQQYACDLSTLPAGVYYVRMVCPADGWSATTSVIKTGAAQAPWKLDLHEMVK
jgi:hypothetical protein